MRRTPLVDVLSTLAREGLDPDEAVRFCAGVYDDPVFEGGKWLAEQFEKLQSTLRMREQMRALSDTALEVERRSGLSRQNFLDAYYCQNIPVVLTDVCDRWAARSLWTPAYLADKLGPVEVEVMAGREADPFYEINGDRHKTLMRFDEYVAKIEAMGPSNDLYLVANNHLLEQPAASSLWNDFDIDSRYLRPDADSSQSFLWLGPAGTVTPLHHDTCNVLFNQVVGKKHFILIPAIEGYRLYNNIGVYSDVDPLAPDLAKYPLFEGAHQLHIDLAPGETLFLPAGWWHHVEALETSVSISLTAFVYTNQIEWANPTHRL